MMLLMIILYKKYNLANQRTLNPQSMEDYIKITMQWMYKKVLVHPVHRPAQEYQDIDLRASCEHQPQIRPLTSPDIKVVLLTIDRER